MLSELNENKLFQLRVYSKKISEEGLRLISENEDRFNIYQSLFKRFIYCIDAINVLTSEIKNREYRFHEISIILRASLLDCLTILYFSTLQTEHRNGIKLTETSYTEEYYKLISEQIRRILTIKEKDKIKESYNHQRFIEITDSIYEKFHVLFDINKPIDYNKPSKSLKYSQNDDITLRKMRNHFDNYTKDIMQINYYEIINLYDYYSKYDHFGIVSMFLEQNDINENCEKMFSSLIHITDGISFCIDLMIKEAESKSDFSLFLEEIDGLRSFVYTKTLYLSDKYKNENS